MNTPSSCPFSTARISIAFEPQPITCESPIRAGEREGEGKKGQKRGGKEGREEEREGREEEREGRKEKKVSIQPLGMLTGKYSCTVVMVYHLTTAKPPNRGHFGDRPFVPCREVVLFSEVLF